jgi:hypothetical protein
MRRLLGLGTAAVVAMACVFVYPLLVLADVPGSYTSYGYGTGVHTISGSSAFPNFQNGAVNNHYPLAQVQEDASPSSVGKATFSDSGPLADTAGSQYNQSCSAGNPPPPPSACQNPNNQVPYATSTYPGGPDKAHVDSCSPSTASSQQQNPCPGGQAASRGDSDAYQLSADAWGYYAGGGTQPFSGATGASHTVVGSNGVLTVTTHSEVNNFAIGTVQVSKVTVDTIATSTMSAGTADAHVVVGQVTVGGQPVSVNDQGLTVQQTQPVPCPAVPVPSPPPGPAPASSPPAVIPSPTGLPTLPADKAGYAGPSQADTSCVPGADVTYIKIFTAKPTKTVDGSHATASATGLHVLVTHPTPGPGVPQQNTEYVLGEGFAETNAGAGGGFGFGGFAGFGFGDFSGFGFDQGFGAGADIAGATNGPAGAIASLLTNRQPLAFLFFTLEALVMASAAAWVWARNAPVDEVAEEVLAP